MVLRMVVVLACLAGCDKLFGLTELGDPQPTPDATGDSGPFDSCPGYTLTATGSPSRYRLERTGAHWQVGEALCERDTMDTGGHSHLVVLSDDSERLAVYTMLMNEGVTSSVWIGLSDLRTEGEFRWVTIEPVGTPPSANPPWAPGQPDNNNDAQDCARIQAQNQMYPSLFDDTECGLELDYLCECDGFAADPTGF